ncbi:MAG: hypothetical protein INR63_04605 [Actinomycetospora chiangmaiensis]|nr:hypothetical protein [Actinomycetospora chiangmaiensis]
MPLTGRFWFRRTWTGKPILLVEEERGRWLRRRLGSRRRWRDATWLDLAEVLLRGLMTLERTCPAGPERGFGTQAAHASPGTRSSHPG